MSLRFIYMLPTTGITKFHKKDLQLLSIFGMTWSLWVSIIVCQTDKIALMSSI